MTGVLLAGGLGTRLHSVLPGTAKPLAPVEGRPFLFFLLEQLIRAGVSPLVLCSGHLAGQVRAEIGTAYGGVPIVYSEEDRPLGTGGALRLAWSNYPDTTPWVVMNGDSYLDINLEAMMASHVRSGLAATIAAVKVEDGRRYGSLEWSDDDHITVFREKSGAPGPRWINGGVYIFERDFVAALPDRAPLSLETEAFPAWLARGIHAFPSQARFIDIGTPESYALAQRFFMTEQKARPFILLDRDGTIIVEKVYLASADEIELLPGAVEGLRLLQDTGFGLVVITNQSGIARGKLTPHTLEGIHAELSRQLADEGIHIDAFYHCPHLPEGHCDCRKPLPLLAGKAAVDLGFNLSNSFVIGDKPCDIGLGKNCGARTVLVRTGYGREHEAAGLQADLVVDDLLAAARAIRAMIGSVLTPTARERLRRHVIGSIETKQRLLVACEDGLIAAAETITTSLQAGGKILLCGNGGSAADCQHIAAEFVSVLNQSFLRPGLPAIALTTDTSVLTASANDFGFEGVFARQTQALGRPGDVLIGISTSGNSANVLRAFGHARSHGIRTIGLTGEIGGKMLEACDICLRAPSDVTQFIQESHIMMGHILCDLAEQSLQFD
jgi:phosphoheptose isomerase